jgi:hypothetical protein
MKVGGINCGLLVDMMGAESSRREPMHSSFRAQGLGVSILFLRIAAELNRV